jgi:hypothetical protein
MKADKHEKAIAERTKKTVANAYFCCTDGIGLKLFTFVIKVKEQKWST